MTIILIMAAAYLMHFAPESWTAKLKKTYHGLPLVVQTVVLALVILMIIQSRQSDIQPFIYLQY